MSTLRILWLARASVQICSTHKCCEPTDRYTWMRQPLEDVLELLTLGTERVASVQIRRAFRVLGDDPLRIIVREHVDTMHRNVTIDWASANKSVLSSELQIKLKVREIFNDKQ